MRKRRSKALAGVLLISSGAIGSTMVTAAPAWALPQLLSLSPIRLFPPPSPQAPVEQTPFMAPAPPVPAPPPPPAPAPVAKAPAAPPSSSATPDKLAKLRRCESGGNYGAKGRRYYGAYQFSPSTWRSLGYSGLPHEAPPHLQDDAARRLASRSGWSQWPACARKLGLR